MSSFDDLVNSLPAIGTANRPPIQSTSGEIRYIEAANPRYVPPSFRELESVSAGQPSIVLITASAAVGKSTIARELAWRTGAPLWDLAEVEVGNYTFVGGKVKHFGPALSQQVTQGLADGSFLIVLDSLDEATLAVYPASFEAFIDDLCTEFRGNPAKPTLVMLARGDTSDTIALKFMDSDVPFVHYAIDFFDAEGARAFIECRGIGRSGDSPPLGEAVEEFFKFIIDLLKPEVSDPWQDEKVRSFLGYAPVLEAIERFLKDMSYAAVVKTVKQLKEAHKTLSTAEKQSPWPVLANLVGDLLVREQQKFLDRLRGRLGAAAEDWKDLNLAYAPDEQLRHICHKHFLSDGDDVLPAGIPDKLRQGYLDTVKENLRTHPLLGDKPDTYANLVFEEYLYAFALRQGTEAWGHAVRARTQEKGYLPMPLLGRFLLLMTEEGETVSVRAADFGIVYDSLLSQATTKGQILVNIYEVEVNGADEGPNIEAMISMVNFDISAVSFSVVEYGPGIRFNRRLCYATVDVPCSIYLGNPGRDFKLGPDVELYCNRMVVPAKLVEVIGAPETEVILRADTCDSSLARISQTTGCIGAENLG